MAVKCLTDDNKKHIIKLFQRKKATQRDLARNFFVSERTIHRVLEEAGLATTIPRIQGEAYQVMQTLKKYNFAPEDLESLFRMVTKPLTIEDVVPVVQEASVNQMLYLTKAWSTYRRISDQDVSLMDVSSVEATVRRAS